MYEKLGMINSSLNSPDRSCPIGSVTLTLNGDPGLPVGFDPTLSEHTEGLQDSAVPVSAEPEGPMGGGVDGYSGHSADESEDFLPGGRHDGQ